MKPIRQAAVYNFPRLWPVAPASLLFLLALTWMVVTAMRVCGGHFGYPLDDTYIHMAMAKNFALHDIWGITKYEFSSSTSSPLYTLLLAGCYMVSGVREITPLLLNTAASLAFIFCCDFVFQQRGISGPVRIPLLCLLVFAVPLPSLAFVGMEHALHAALTVLFVHLCCKELSRRANFRSGDWVGLWVLTPLLATVRYEAVLLIGTAGLLFLAQGRWRVTAGLAGACIIPLAAYGWFSMLHGWYPIPNSLLLKANLPGLETTGIFGTFGATLWLNLWHGAHLVLLVVAAAGLIWVMARRRQNLWTYSQTGLVLFTATACLHLCFARVGWYYRYESYLMALGLITIACAIHDHGFPARGRLAACGYVLAAVFSVVAIYRTAHATLRAPQAVSDIYDQQYQTGLFVGKYIGNRTIVLDDIGAVSFLSEARILDLVGLGSLDSMRARRDRNFSPSWLYRWSRQKGAVLAITYRPLASPRWDEVATWTIPGNYMSGSDTVGIYAVDPKFRQALVNGLAQFRPQLPSRVIQRNAAMAGTVRP